MLNRLLRCGALMIALATPLAGCLEVVGAKMNRGPTVAQDSGCAHNAQPWGEIVNYGCAPAGSTAQ